MPLCTALAATPSAAQAVRVKGWVERHDYETAREELLRLAAELGIGLDEQ